MTARKRILLHIGHFKTGTKSIQKFLREMVGVPVFPMGMWAQNVHLELSLYCLRESARGELFRSALHKTWLGFDESDRTQLRKDVYRIVRAQVESDVPRIIYSNEALAWVREASELGELFELFEGRDVDVVVYRRNPADFLASYKVTLYHLGFASSEDPDSIANLRSDSWLLDFEHRVALWSSRATSIEVIDYDGQVVDRGSVIPSFAEIVGLETSADYRENVTADWLGEMRQTREP